MPPAPGWLQAALQALSRLEKAVCIAGFIGITGALFLDLAGRELLGRGIFGAQRFAAYCMVVVAFVGFALAVEWRAHLGIEVADKLTPAAWNPQMERLADLTSAAACIFLAYWSWRFVLGSFRDQAVGQGIVILLWPVQSVLIWCFASSALKHLAYAAWPSLRPGAGAAPESVETT
jgi:TRAP-type C4-dicarboxylate transport system permease small subunit